MNNTSIQVSVIIVNYNTTELVLQAIESIKEYVKDTACEIIVVDNDSEDKSIKASLVNEPDVKLICLEENKGFGIANNVGFKESEGKYIFLLNSDAYLIEKDTVSKMIKYLENHDDVGCVGSNLIDSNGMPNISYGNFLSVEKVLHDFGLRIKTYDYYQANLVTAKVCDVNEPTYVDYVSGASMMIKRSVIDNLGLFNPKYFMYFEDQDLCFRYLKNGYKSVILPDAKIVHIGGQSGIKSTTSNPKLQSQIAFSKYLFLLNVTNNLTALSLYIYGKLYSFNKKVWKKLMRF